ncbi:hypothetical protein BKA82DRAFT_1000125 [Pisolithus tinctorius]|uniref:Uncharacterized protein n=1 Tax=Pisolithus tinctorius Marx 270 TaxID=870435 RepID=A0A0C3J7N0_PISTI|nr:hypothetical protein BKA82DRAFT_1000125 [Pisolithus tinctorius]KIO05058.1 hypothetical protein M404DRAFT_1000125 [Pisolithus tinctorius Marx 270]
MSGKEMFTLSSLSLTSADWDRSESDIHPPPNGRVASSATPRNSVAFPGNGTEDTPGRTCGGRGGRSLSELMRLHAEKGTDVTFTAEEVSSVADVLKQWINSGTSPYEGEDDFFSRSHDDSSLASRRSSRHPSDTFNRPRGQSESTVVPRSPKPDASFS